MAESFICSSITCYKCGYMMDIFNDYREDNNSQTFRHPSNNCPLSGKTYLLPFIPLQEVIK